MATEQIRGKWWQFGWTRNVVVESSAESAVDTPVTLLTPTGQMRRITSVDVHYLAPVSLDIILTLRSGVGAFFDTVQEKKTLASAQDWHWVPLGDRFLSGLDVFEVLTPAGGVGITGAATVKSEVF